MSCLRQHLMLVLFECHVMRISVIFYHVCILGCTMDLVYSMLTLIPSMLPSSFPWPWPPRERAPRLDLSPYLHPGGAPETSSPLVTGSYAGSQRHGASDVTYHLPLHVTQQAEHLPAPEVLQRYWGVQQESHHLQRKGEFNRSVITYKRKVCGNNGFTYLVYLGEKSGASHCGHCHSSSSLLWSIHLKVLKGIVSICVKLLM